MLALKLPGINACGTNEQKGLILNNQVAADDTLCAFSIELRPFGPTRFPVCLKVIKLCHESNGILGGIVYNLHGIRKC